MDALSAMQSITSAEYDELAQGKGKGKSAAKSPGAPKPKAPAPAPAPTTLTDTESEFVARVAASHKKKAAQPAQETPDAIVAKKASLVRKIGDYQRLFGPRISDHARYTTAYPIDQLKEVLANCRMDVASGAAESQIREGLPTALAGLETLTMTWGINPLNLDLTGWSGFIRDPKTLAEIDDEINECIIDCRGALTMPWYLRLPAKVSMLASNYSSGRKLGLAQTSLYKPSDIPPPTAHVAQE